uniref:Uncharacterized protein n=1 Tax=Anguilla anguilla TaxID=7936 RepID=A0A0E9R0A2_ANGAN
MNCVLFSSSSFNYYHSHTQ